MSCRSPRTVPISRTPAGSLPLSCGTVEGACVRCGYHFLLYAPNGQCIEIPGQDRIPSKARVKAYEVIEKNADFKETPYTPPKETVVAVNYAVTGGSEAIPEAEHDEGDSPVQPVKTG